MRTAVTLLIPLALAWSCGDETEPRSPRPPEETVSQQSREPPHQEAATDEHHEHAEPGVHDAETNEADTERGSGTDAGVTASPLPTGKPILIDFTRDHCLPCEIMAPWVDELRKKHVALVQVVEINIDRKENKPLARYFKARSIPTQVYIDEHGREVSRNVGLATKQEMESKLKRLGFLDPSSFAESRRDKKRKKRK